MVKGWLLSLIRPVLLLPEGLGERSRHRTQRKKEKRGLLPANTGHQLPPLTLPPPQVLAPPAASKLASGDASRTPSPRLGSRDWGASGVSLTPPRCTRAFRFSAIFLGSPDPAIASLPSPATRTAAEIFRNATAGVVISSPTDPDAFPLGEEEEGRWGREHEEEGEEKARPGERPCHRPESPRQRGGQAPGGGGKNLRPGEGGEDIRSSSWESALEATASAGTLGASLGTPPRPAAPLPLQELGVSFFFKKNFSAARSLQRSRAGLILEGLRCAHSLCSGI